LNEGEQGGGEFAAESGQVADVDVAAEPGVDQQSDRPRHGAAEVALLDTGLAARLNNVTPAAMAPGVVSEVAGGLFEAFVAAELRRQFGWSDADVSLFHFRDRDGPEVDLVLEDADRRVAGVEVKAARTVTKKDFKGLEFLRDKLGDRFTLGVLLHTGQDALPFGDRLWALPYSAMWS